MRTSEEWCKFFADIEKNPHAIVTDFKIRDYLEARAHMDGCTTCQESAERVLARAPQDPPNRIGFN